MRKFLAYCSAVFQNATAYRAEQIIWLIIEAFPVFVMVQLWQHLEQAGRITSTEAAYLTLYYLLALVISRLTSSHFEEWVSDDIKDGKISTSLLKPMSYPVFLLANELIWRMMGTLVQLPLLIFFVPRLLSLRGLTYESSAILLAILMVVFSFFLRFFFSWLISLMAFWTDQTSFFGHLKQMAEGFFGGEWLPLTFFPLWLQAFSKWTPFYTWYFVPIELVTGNMRAVDALPHAGSAIVWGLLLAGISWWLWKRALKRYSAVGG